MCNPINYWYKKYITIKAKAVDGKVNQDGILELSNGEAIDICPSLDKCALGLRPGDKVKLIIVKDR